MVKKYAKELVALGLQLLTFYVGPLCFLELDPIGTLLGLVTMTFLLALWVGFVSRCGWKWLYLLVTMVFYVPSVFLFYKPTSLVYVWWYLVMSILGLVLGSMIYGFLKK